MIATGDTNGEGVGSTTLVQVGAGGGSQTVVEVAAEEGSETMVEDAAEAGPETAVKAGIEGGSETAVLVDAEGGPGTAMLVDADRGSETAVQGQWFFSIVLMLANLLQVSCLLGSSPILCLLSMNFWWLMSPLILEQSPQTSQHQCCG
jgi:hypothetical protein